MTYYPRALTAAAVLLGTASTALINPTKAVADHQTGKVGVYATFEGVTINLAEGWGDASACTIDGAGSARCFRTEAELDTAVKAAAAISNVSESILAGTCTSSLRLYSSASHLGTVLNLSATGTWINLSAYGFNDATSSYRVGACAATFKSGSSGSGTTYPGSTAANAAAPTMVSGWDDTVSSVRLT